ncbi:MAG: alpha/beta hydrolase [Zavarzinella sp.]
MFSAISTLVLLLAQAPVKEIPLWDGEPPASVGGIEKNRATVAVYQPEPSKATGAAVVVCPGGGYGGLAIGHEGFEIAKFLNDRGIVAVLLRYRTASQRPTPLKMAPLLDAQRAIRWTRANATQYGIKADKIGIWGFSAGGHLASTASTHFDEGNKEAKDPVDQVSCRPDFSILSYPVITMNKEVTHGGSKRNLLGESPTEEEVAYFSNELHVTAKTPPTFLFHTHEDKVVLPENAILYYLALKKAGVPAEIHLYEKGPHGVGLSQNPKGSPAAQYSKSWPGMLENWLKLRQLIP